MLAGLAGLAGWLVLVGRSVSRPRLKWSGHGIKVQHHLARCWRAGSASATVLPHATTLTEGNNKTGTKGKEDLQYRNVVCIHVWCMWMEHKLPDSAQSAGKMID